MPALPRRHAGDQPAHRAERARWIAVASGNSLPAEVEEFKNEFGVSFPIAMDTDHGFQQAVGARSTPSVYLVAPSTTPAKTSGMKSLLLTPCTRPTRAVSAPCC
jgi:hypothetical protein